MMRTINIVFTDKEFKKLKDIKDKDGRESWHKFILKLVTAYKKSEN